MNTSNYQQFRFGKIKVTFRLDTKRHIWEVYFLDVIRQESKPTLEFSRKKGLAVLEFTQELEKSLIHVTPEP